MGITLSPTPSECTACVRLPEGCGGYINVVTIVCIFSEAPRTPLNVNRIGRENNRINNRNNGLILKTIEMDESGSK